MDNIFHLQQGQQLLEKQDTSAIKRALEHFKKANEMTEDKDIGKPKILYHLAIGNYFIGQIEQSYKIAHKAKRSIGGVIENSKFSMTNMRQVLGEEDIDALIRQILEKFPQVTSDINIYDDDFDENKLDFSLLSQLYQTADKEDIKPQFSIENLSDEVLIATFFGLSRTNDELIYFDKLKGDVLSHVQGYFSSHIGDQSTANRLLANRITNIEPIDFVDEERYILIDRLKLTEFLKEFKKQTEGKEPFLSFVDYFSIEVLKDYKFNNDLTIDDLANSNHIQEKFHELFGQKYQNRILELRTDFTIIFQNTSKAIALNWIKKNITNGNKNIRTINANMKLNFVFESGDHLRFENGKHVSGPHGGARRAIKVEPNISGKEGYTVTVYNLDGNHPVWQNNVQMAPKQMKVILQANEKIVLRGYGNDAMGSSFVDYGLTVYYNENKPMKLKLHMHDRNVDIEYLKSSKEVKNEPDIVKLAKEAIAQYQTENLSGSRSFLVQIYLSVKEHPEQLNKVTNFENLGKAFLLMLDQSLADDIDILQMMASVGYLCISKAIEKDKQNFNLYKDRLLLLQIGHDSFKYTVISALNLNADGLMSMGYSDFEARDAIYKMEIADIELNPILYQKIDFFRERRSEFRQMIAEEFFLPEKTKQNVIKSGIDNHKKVFTYLENRVLENGDVDF